MRIHLQVSKPQLAVFGSGGQGNVLIGASLIRKPLCERRLPWTDSQEYVAQLHEVEWCKD
jgi:hypothetical protein